MPAGKNRHQLLRRNHLELRERTIARALVVAPPAKMRRVPKAISLHVIVCDLDDELGSQRLPRQILALTPSAHAARHAMLRPLVGDCASAHARHGCASSAFSRYGARNSTSSRRFAAVKLALTPTCCESARVVVEAEQQRANRRPVAAFVPPKPGDNAVARAFVLDLDHHALVRLVGAGFGFAMTPSSPAPSNA